jgi:hypothetical protein
VLWFVLPYFVREQADGGRQSTFLAPAIRIRSSGTYAMSQVAGRGGNPAGYHFANQKQSGQRMASFLDVDDAAPEIHMDLAHHSAIQSHAIRADKVCCKSRRCVIKEKIKRGKCQQSLFCVTKIAFSLIEWQLKQFVRI